MKMLDRRDMSLGAMIANSMMSQLPMDNGIERIRTFEHVYDRSYVRNESIYALAEHMSHDLMNDVKDHLDGVHVKTVQARVCQGTTRNTRDKVFVFANIYVDRGTLPQRVEPQQ